MPVKDEKSVLTHSKAKKHDQKFCSPDFWHGGEWGDTFFKACSELGIQQIFASYSNPKGNADTERVIRTLKEDLVWPREFDSIADFEKALNVWQKEYNEDYPHSSLGYMTPYEYERWFQASAA